MEIFQIITLSLSGLMLFFVGIMRLFKPANSYCLKTYLANPNNTLNNDRDLSNEMRGIGSVTLFAGILILLGLLLSDFRFTSFIVATLVFVGFALGRILSQVVDGKPSKDLIQGLVFELIFGTLNLICLIYLLT
ncbi:DUF4345 domain-containing protein [Muricauda sp. 2012CJ35-5]|uniref:DUF4345 domain-containing protein n=1 Tax=Flagellimonas spongiicola TaxID=2942208 RepID=A0ABT0PU79_9FLAO|nr:DUF4345 domain-containing protein [Allomuricauda spongiicola]MCL6274924.1 DUF4345 domain-containing protein [Allomuricauda spongiicola]